MRNATEMRADAEHVLSDKGMYGSKAQVRARDVLDLLEVAAKLAMALKSACPGEEEWEEQATSALAAYDAITKGADDATD